MTEKSRLIKKIMALLARAYGKPPERRPSDPVDELVRTILSQNTSDRNSMPAFGALKRSFGSWARVLAAPASKISSPIKHAGLANIKAKRIKDVLRRIRGREGSITLKPLRAMEPEEAMEYLTSLEGVGPKTASCVLLFSFGMPVMPVDTHIFRVTKRLGLIARKTGIDQAHKELTATVPKGLIYDFHLSIIEHGRRTCMARNPACGSCILYSLCRSSEKRKIKA